MSFYVYRTQRAEMRRAKEIACHVVRESDFRLVGGRGIDLSPDGMLVTVTESVDVGESLIISFRATELGIWFDTDAIVTRCVRGRRAGDPQSLREPCERVLHSTRACSLREPCERVLHATRACSLAIGVRFGSLDAVSRLILRAHLKHVAPPVPRRERALDYAATVGRILSIPRAA
jgi:hypothetical protein